MRILFDYHSKNIAGIFADDQPDTISGCFEVYVPKDITSRLDKTANFARQKRNHSGKPLFTTNGKETETTITNGKANEPAIEQASFTRSVSLKESASEWTLSDVLAAKYKILANGKSFWFDEFINDSAIDKNTSVVNIGVGAVTIPNNSALQLCSIKLSNAVSRLTLYIEGGDGLDTEYSLNGNDFELVTSGVVTLQNPADTFIFRFINARQDAPAIPIKAIAIFF